MSIPLSPAQQISARFTLTESDYMGYHRYLITRQLRKGLPLLIFVCIVMIFNIWSTLTRYGALSHQGIAAILLSVAPLLLGIGFQFVTLNNAKRAMAEVFSHSLDRSFKAAAGGFALDGGDRSGSYRWSGIQSLEQDKNSIYIFVSFGQAFFVPKRAFGDTRQAAQVLSVFQSMYKAAAHQVFAYSGPHISPASQIASVTYQCKEPDAAKLYAHLLAATGMGKRIKMAAIGLPVALVVFGAAINFDRIQATGSVASISGYITTGLIWMAIMLFSMSPKALASKQRTSPMLRGPQTIAIGRDQLANTTLLGTTLYSWPYVIDVAMIRGDLFVTLKGQAGLIVPRATFTSDADAAAFAQIVTAAWKGDTSLLPKPQETSAWPPAPSLTR